MTLVLRCAVRGMWALRLGRAVCGLLLATPVGRTRYGRQMVEAVVQWVLSTVVVAVTVAGQPFLTVAASEYVSVADVVPWPSEDEP